MGPDVAGMIPSKSKKALPSSTSMAFPEYPITLFQWKTALQRIKFLYLKGQLNQCSAQCNKLLSEVKTLHHPLHATYLHFYAALSIEGIARLSHNLSAPKVHLLQQARATYAAAASSLPKIERGFDVDEAQDSEVYSDDSSLAATPSLTRPISPAYSSSSSTGSYSLTEPQYQTVSMPSPLRIRKPFLSSPFQTLPSSPPLTPPYASINFAASTTNWLQSRAHARFHTHLDSFSAMVAAHIAVVDDLLRVTREVQASRHAGANKRLPSYGVDEETKAQDRKARILALREKGWRRERFLPERYMAVCERAMAEL